MTTTAQEIKQALGTAEGYGYDKFKTTDILLANEQRKVEQENQRKGSLQDYDCPICLNRGHVALIGDNGLMVVRRCECLKTRASIKAAKESGAWDLMQKHNFDNYKDDGENSEWRKQIKRLAREYTKQGKWLFAGGQTGAGKTHLCTAAFKMFFKKPVDGLYIIWRDEARRLLGAGFAGAEVTEARIQQIKDSEVLYIDDLFQTDNNKEPERREVELAFEIINSRYNSELVTIISSEKMIKDIAKINPAIAGRIKERCGKYVIEVEKDDNKNYRLVGTNG